MGGWRSLRLSPYESQHPRAVPFVRSHFLESFACLLTSLGIKFPVPDYYGDLKNVLDQAVRILQAMCDICADAGWLNCVLNIIALLQMIVQGHWRHDSQLIQLPHMAPKVIDLLEKQKISSLPEICSLSESKLESILSKVPSFLIPFSLSHPKVLTKNKVQKIRSVLDHLPIIDVKYKLVLTLHSLCLIFFYFRAKPEPLEKAYYLSL